MKFEMMLKMLMYLLSHDVVSAGLLAEKFEISRRSVYRYAEALNNAGFPVVQKRGPKGGLYIPDYFKLPASFLTESELSATLQAVDRVQAESYSEALESAKAKLIAVKRDVVEDYKLAGGYVVIDGAPWGDSYGFRKKLDAVRRAMDENRMIRIVYHDRNGEETDREIEPHYLLLKQGQAYVYAYCHLRKDFRFFKLGRITYLTPLYQNFVRRETPDFETATEFRTNFTNVEVEMEIDAAVRSEVEEWLGIDNVHLRHDGKIIATALLPDDQTLPASIMRFGTHVKVLSPSSLVKTIKHLADNILKKYEK